MASSKARSRNSGGAGARGASGARPASGKGRAGMAARAQAAPAVKAAPVTPAKPAVKATSATPATPGRPVRQAEPAKAAERKAEPAATAVTPEPERSSGPPLWLQLVSLALAVLGLAVSAYETYAHYTGKNLAGCPTGKGGTFDCAAVISSPQSMVFGVLPVAVLGLAFYVFVVAIMTPWAWRMQRLKAGPLRLSVGGLRLAAMITGMGFVMYLIYAELYQIQQVCEYCSGVHIITFLLFCITVFSAAVWGLGKPGTAAS